MTTRTPLSPALFAASVCLLLVASAASGATFVVPPDRELARRSDAVIVAKALTSYVTRSDSGAIETVTRLAIDDVIRGPLAAESTMEVVEPGGVFGDLVQVIPGVPRFVPGERTVLFLRRSAPSRWSVTDLALGKFSLVPSPHGELALRNTDEIHGWDTAGNPFKDRPRQAEGFLAYLKAIAVDGPADDAYFIDVEPVAIAGQSYASSSTRREEVLIAPYTATSYTMVMSGSLGGRWSVFPGQVSWLRGLTQEAGAPGGGTTAINAAFASWNGDAASNVNYVLTGTDDGSHNKGLTGSDGANTVLFERDLSGWGISPFTCSSNSYGGTLGIGGVTRASGQHALGSETFLTILEGDVEMNRGLANCTLLFSGGEFNSGMTHEVGHTLGFRHSDQDRNSSGACDPGSMECSGSAIMTSAVTHGLNAALQSWDQHAVQALYPAGGSGSTCTPPSIAAQPSSSSITQGQSTTLSVVANGTAPLSYQWYMGGSGDTSNPISGANGTSLTISTSSSTPAGSTAYWVRVSNACGAVNSNAAVVTVTAPPSCTPVSITAQPNGTTTSAGTPVTLSVGVAGTTPITFQWYVGASGDRSFPLPGAQTSSITVTPSSTTSYWVAVSNACGAANSATATVTVAAASCTPPSITAQPASSGIQSGSTATLSVGVSGTGPISYQWFVGSPGTGSPISGATGPTITVSPQQTTTYWVRVTGACGTADSSGATVTVTAPSSTCTPPSITVQPSGTTIRSGQSATLGVVASGSGTLAYQWFIGTTGTGSPLFGATGPTLTVSPSTTTSYWVRVSNGCGTVDSATATITVRQGQGRPRSVKH